jgi:S1-C subfamily serine protease
VTNPRRVAAADIGFTSGSALRTRRFATCTSKTTCLTHWRASPVRRWPELQPAEVCVLRPASGSASINGLTNHHVVSGASSVRLVLSSGRTVTAEVVGSDADDDIAVLRASAGDLRAARLGVSADLRIGQPVIAVGSPLGLNGTVTSGVVSALDRGASAEAMIQTDASINPGNSGGPLVDLNGRVVGINTSIATIGGHGSGNIGIGFAVPIDRALDVARQILARG